LQGRGWATSSELARQIAERLIEHGEVVSPWLGISMQELTLERRQTYEIMEHCAGFACKGGVLVFDVNAQSPAAKAGLRQGDAIMEWDGKPVQNVGMFRPMVTLTELGAVVEVKIIRNGKPKWLSVHLTEPRPRQSR